MMANTRTLFAPRGKTIHVLSHPLGDLGVMCRVHLWTVRYRNDVATTLLLVIFTQRNFSQTFSTEVEFYWQKQQNHLSCHPLGELRVTYTVHLWLAGKCVVDFLLMVIELFCQFSRLKRYEWILVKTVVFKRGWVTMSASFSGKGDHPPPTLGVRKLVPGLSRGIVCVVLCLAIFIQYRRVTDRHTDTDIRWQLIPVLA